MSILGNLEAVIGKKDPDIAQALRLLATVIERHDTMLSAKALKPQGVGETGGVGPRKYTFASLIRALKTSSTIEE